MFIGIVVPVTWLLYIAIRALRCVQTKVPGPLYTSFTSLYLKKQEFTGQRRVYIHGLHKKYGPVVRLAPNEISFADLEGMKEIYQSGGCGYDKTTFYDLFMQYDRRTMFSTLNKQDHAQRKKLFADRYAMTNIVRPSILQGIQDRATSVVNKCIRSIGGSLDVYEVLHCYALDCASHFLFNPGGTDTLNNPKDFVLYQELSYDNSLPWRWLAYYSPAISSIISKVAPGARYAPLSKAYVLDQAHTSHTDETSLIHKLQSKSSDIETLVSAAECMDHMAAGIDTTGDGLCFLMYELSLPSNLHMQKRLRDEILQNPDAKVDDLLYLDAVVKEGLRMFPPIPMSLPRHVPEGGRTISGYEIPEATIVSCQAYSMHRIDESVFPDPDYFLPERWLEEKGMSERQRMFFSFAAGSRGCIGKNLALMEMKTLLVEIYSRFTTKVAPEMNGDMSIDDQIIASRPKDQTCLLKFQLAKA